MDQKPAPQAQVAPQKPHQAEEKDYRHIVRIANTDIDGTRSLLMGLMAIKGVGRSFSNMVCQMVKINKSKKIGNLNAEEVARLEKVLQNPAAAGAPNWMFNRRKDYETGIDMHILLADLDFNKDNDIKRLKKIKAYRGVRHMFNQPTRGQRTKSNFRDKKGAKLGVVKKKTGAPAPAAGPKK